MVNVSVAADFGSKTLPPLPHYASICIVCYGQSMLQHKGGLRNVGVGVLPSYTLCCRKTDDRLWKSLTTNQVHLLSYTNSYSTQVQSRKIGVFVCEINRRLHHEVTSGSGVTAPLTRNLGAGCTLVISFIRRPFYLRGDASIRILCSLVETD